MIRTLAIALLAALAGCAQHFHPRLPAPPVTVSAARSESEEFSCNPPEIPAPEPNAYQDDDLEFAVELPVGYRACVGACTGHGVAVDLSGEQDCMSPAFAKSRGIGFYGSYTSWFVDLEESERNVSNLADRLCKHVPARMLRRLRDQRIGDRRAEGCQRVYPNGTIAIDLAALRKIPNEGSSAGIEIGAWLRTTPEHRAEDERIFRQMLANTWIRRDGPQNFYKTGRE